MRRGKKGEWKPKVDGPPEKRFWAKVDKSNEDGCWVWTGSINSYGYGHFWVDNKPVRAHRWLFEQAYGPLPKDRVVRHKCNTPACIRLDHLVAGTPKENSQDAVRAGRISRKGGRSLGQEKMANILRLRKLGHSALNISNELKIDQKTVERYLKIAEVVQHAGQENQDGK